MENWENLKNQLEAYIQNEIKAYLLFIEISASELSSSEKRDEILEAIKHAHISKSSTTTIVIRESL